MGLLALALVFAQPASYLAWLDGAHATLDQVQLHGEAMARGNPHHHGGSGAGVVDGPEIASAETLVVYLDASVPQLRLTAAAAELPPDFLKGVLLGSPVFLEGFDSRPLVPFAVILQRQHYPPVPHRPPLVRPF